MVNYGTSVYAILCSRIYILVPDGPGRPEEGHPGDVD